MNLNSHSPARLPSHAFLSPSKHAWVNYEEDKLDRVFFAHKAAQRGTELHAFANDAIRLGIKLPDVPSTLNQYVNDAIGYRMTPELILYYSDNCFGTADAIAFRNNTLRVSDLKTGVTEASMVQLEIYAALFCLEYKFKPFDIKMELRIYQNDGVALYVPGPEVIAVVMEKIIWFDKRINYLRMEDM